MEENRRRVAEICEIAPRDITKDCVETSASFICLKVEKPDQISKSVPDKILVFIAIERLHSDNDMFTKVDLRFEEDSILSDDDNQIFVDGQRGGGIGVLLRIKFKTRL